MSYPFDIEFDPITMQPKQRPRMTLEMPLEEELYMQGVPLPWEGEDVARPPTFLTNSAGIEAPPPVQGPPGLDSAPAVEPEGRRRPKLAEILEAGAGGFLAAYNPEKYALLTRAKEARKRTKMMEERNKEKGGASEAAMRNYIAHADPKDPQAQEAAKIYQQKYGSPITPGYMRPEQEEKGPSATDLNYHMRMAERGDPRSKAWLEQNGYPFTAGPEEAIPAHLMDDIERQAKAGSPQAQEAWAKATGVPWYESESGDLSTAQLIQMAPYSEAARRELQEMGYDWSKPPREAAPVSPTSLVGHYRQILQRTDPNTPEAAQIRAKLEEALGVPVPPDFGDEPGLLEQMGITDPFIKQYAQKIGFTRQYDPWSGNTTYIPKEDLHILLPEILREARLAKMSVEAENAPPEVQSVLKRMVSLEAKYPGGNAPHGARIPESDLARAAEFLGPEVIQELRDLGLIRGELSERAAQQGGQGRGRTQAPTLSDFQLPPGYTTGE